MMKKNLFGIAFTAAFIAAGSFYYQSHIVPDSFWGDRPNQVSRVPANKLFSGKDIRLYKDFFSQESYGKYVRYEMKFKSWTDKDGDHFKEKGKEALEQAIKNTLIKSEQNKVDNITTPITTIFKENITSEIISKFIKTLYIYKIFNATFQLDLNFLPITSTGLNYHDEMDTNQLVDLSRKGELFKKVKDGEQSLIQKVYSAHLPETNTTYQYHGGNISFWIKLLDMTVDPLRPIPNPKKNAVKGFIRYRRYFKANSFNGFDKLFDQPEIQVRGLEVISKEKHQPFFITVDVYKSFNLANLVPELDRIEIHLGKLLPDNIHRDSLLGKLLGKKEKAIKTGVLEMRGTLRKDQTEFPFTTKIEKIVFDARKKKFSNKSKIKTEIKKSRNFDEDFGQEESETKSLLLSKYRNSFVDYFELDRFHKIFKEAEQ